MKHAGGCLAWLLLALSAALPAVGATAAPGTKCMQRAQAALVALTHDRFDQATAHFAPEAASQASPAVLQDAWRQIVSQFGDFTSLGQLAPREIAGHRLLVASLAFARGALDALVGCDAEDRITTFRLVPAAALPSPAGSTDAPMSPAAAMARLQSEHAAAQRGPHPAVRAHVEADGVRVEPLDVPSPFGPLRGALTLPTGKGPFPAVVLVQGSGPQDLDETIGPNKPFRDIADGLGKAGIASLRYDKRAFDYAAKIAAEPDFTVDDEVSDDALAAARLLAKQPSIDPRRVFVLGHSEGAMLAPRIARRDPALAGIIMLAAPARPLLEVSREQIRAAGARGASPGQVTAALQANAAEQALLDAANPAHPPTGTYAGAPQGWWLSLHDYHQLAVAESLALPMLILQGGRDFQVSPTLDFDRWKQALAGHANVTFHLYPGLGHLFRPAGKTGTVADYLQPGAVDPEVIGDIARWISAQPPAR